MAARLNEGQKAWCQQSLDNRNTNRRHQRIAVVSATLITWFETADFLTGEQRRQRHAAADALAERHDVWRDACVFVGEQLTGAPHAGLYFIDDE